MPTIEEARAEFATRAPQGVAVNAVRASDIIADIADTYDLHRPSAPALKLSKPMTFAAMPTAKDAMERFAAVARASGVTMEEALSAVDAARRGMRKAKP